MRNTLRTGAECRVIMARNDIFVWQDACHWYGELVGVPRGEGDHFRVRHGDVIVSLNPLSADLIAITQPVASHD